MNATIASQPASTQASTGKLPFGLKLGWGTGALGVAVLMNGISGLILLFAASILKIDPWLAGVVIFLSKLFDVITDPLVGHWSDRHKGPKGRRRPFMLWGSIAGAASFVIIFTTPSFESQYATAAYLFLALCIYAFGYTLYNIPYMAMSAEMTEDYHERSSLQVYRIYFVVIGSTIATAGVKAALEFFGKTEAQSFAIVGVLCGLIIIVTTMLSYFATAKARFTLAKENETRSNLVQMAESYGAVIKNGHFLRLIGVKFAQLMGVQTMGAAFAYFFVQYLGRDFYVLAIFGVAVTISTLVFSPLLVQFSKAYGKKNAYYVAAAVNIFYAVSWTFSGTGEPVWLIIIRAVLVGIAFGGNVVMAMSMLTDIINEDGDRTGIRREGAFTALYSFVEKLTGALGPLIVGIALTWVGFNKDLPFDVPQGDNVNTALLLAVSWLPAAFYLIAVVLLSGYKLTEDDVTRANSRTTA